MTHENFRGRGKFSGRSDDGNKVKRDGKERMESDKS